MSIRITSAMVYRSLLGAGLKSIGGVYRVNDIPDTHPKLRRQMMMREGLVVLAILGTSILLEGVFSKAMPRLNKNLSENLVQLAEFVPQALAYALAETVSRKVFPVRETLEKAFDDDGDGDNPPSGQGTVKPFVSPQSNPFMAQRYPQTSRARQMLQPPTPPTLFQAQSYYMDNWDTRRQPVTMRGFY